MTKAMAIKFVRLFLRRLNFKTKISAMIAVCLVLFWNSSTNAQLKTSDLGNQPVSEVNVSPTQQSGIQEAQISPEEYKRLMKELEAAKKLIEERNIALDKLMKE